MKGTLFSRKTALDGRPGAMKSLGGFGREVLEGDRKGDDVTDPDGPKWTTWSVSIFFCLMAAWLNEVVVRAVALLSALTKEFDAYYSVVKWQLYKPAMNTEYDQQSPRECRDLYWRVQ